MVLNLLLNNIRKIQVVTILLLSIASIYFWIIQKNWYDIVNDDEYDKQHGDFTNEYEDCIVVVKNHKN